MLSLSIFLSACTLVAKTPEPLTQKSSAADDALPVGEGWWYARFFIDRPEGESPQWHIDTLLAGEVVAPVFEHHYRDILIWRFHRRAADDDYGHVFSFIFYSTAEGAQRVYNELGVHPALAQLRRDGLVTRVAFDDLGSIMRPAIEDTSDENWLPVVQQAWPAMIMGASRMWLEIVTSLAADQPEELGLVDRYLAVNDEVSRIWREQGQHAVLHHLSAIYGYEPLLIRY
jgi:hypothetical protein